MTESCQKFIYGGCKGNANNFRTWEECSEAAEKCVENNEPTNDVCSLPKVRGRCWAMFHRYYFDKNTRSCQKFIYGGCEGNANNFMTEEECNKAAEKCERSALIQWFILQPYSNSNVADTFPTSYLQMYKRYKWWNYPCHPCDNFIILLC